MEIKQPTAATVRKTRLKLGLTQAQAANPIHKAARTWRQWEAGTRAMSVTSWELFLIKNDMSLDYVAR